MYTTIKNLWCRMTKFFSILQFISPMVASFYEWNILKWDVKQHTINKSIDLADLYQLIWLILINWFGWSLSIDLADINQLIWLIFINWFGWYHSMIWLISLNDLADINQLIWLISIDLADIHQLIWLISIKWFGWY